MLAVDTLLKKGGDVDVLGLDESIRIAIAGDPKRFCHLPALHGKMLGEINGRLEAHEEKMCLRLAENGAKPVIYVVARRR